MAAIATESIPTTWDDERDVTFFGITASLFSCEFTYGAGVLLASYDDECETAASATPAAERATATATVAGSTSPVTASLAE